MVSIMAIVILFRIAYEVSPKRMPFYIRWMDQQIATFYDSTERENFMQCVAMRRDGLSLLIHGNNTALWSDPKSVVFIIIQLQTKINSIALRHAAETI
jgi:hypothetical protein